MKKYAALRLTIFIVKTTNLITATEATQVTIANRTLVSVSMFTMTSSARF